MNKDVIIFVLATVTVLLACIVVLAIPIRINALQYLSMGGIVVVPIILISFLLGHYKNKDNKENLENQSVNAKIQSNIAKTRSNNNKNVVTTKFIKIDKSFYDEDKWWVEFAPIMAELVQEQIDNYYHYKTEDDCFTDKILRRIIEDSFDNVSYFPEELKEKTIQAFFELRDEEYISGYLYIDEVVSYITEVFENLEKVIFDNEENVDTVEELYKGDYKKAEKLWKEKNISQAVEIFEFLAKKGHAGAQNYLGYYWYPFGGINNPAIDWWKKSAKQGNKAAQSHLDWLNSDDKEMISFVSRTVDGKVYRIDENIKTNYTKMFRQPFDKVIYEEKFTINKKKCICYHFSLLVSDIFNIGGFWCLIVVKDEIPRYFASERSYKGAYVLCEWEFENETEKKHINYGTIVTTLSDMTKHLDILKEKLKELVI